MHINGGGNQWCHNITLKNGRNKERHTIVLLALDIHLADIMSRIKVIKLRIQKTHRREALMEACRGNHTFLIILLKRI